MSVRIKPRPASCSNSSRVDSRRAQHHHPLRQIRGVFSLEHRLSGRRHDPPRRWTDSVHHATIIEMNGEATGNTPPPAEPQRRRNPLGLALRSEPVRVIAVNWTHDNYLGHRRKRLATNKVVVAQTPSCKRQLCTSFAPLYRPLPDLASLRVAKRPPYLSRWTRQPFPGCLTHCACSPGVLGRTRHTA